MSGHQDHGADACLDATLRRAFEASTGRLPTGEPPIAAVVRAGRRRLRLRRCVTGTALAGVVAALCITVSQMGPGAAPGQPVAGATSRPAPATAPASASPPAVLALGSGTVDGIHWGADARFDQGEVCQHLVIGGTQVDAAAGYGYWNNCYTLSPVGDDQGMGVHVAGDSGLRLLSGFGVNRDATVVVTYSDGRTTSVRPTQAPGSTVGGFVVPIAPGHRLAIIDIYNASGTRVTHDTGYR